MKIPQLQYPCLLLPGSNTFQFQKCGLRPPLLNPKYFLVSPFDQLQLNLDRATSQFSLPLACPFHQLSRAEFMLNANLITHSPAFMGTCGPGVFFRTVVQSHKRQCRCSGDCLDLSCLSLGLPWTTSSALAHLLHIPV